MEPLRSAYRVGGSVVSPSEDVAVVVVTFNALPHIKRCLASVHGYTTVVVDHGSTDGTVELVREFDEVRLVEQENRGLAAGWNRGMAEVAPSPRYYFIVNADAWVHEGAIDALAAFGDSHSTAAIIGPKLLNLDGTLQPSIKGFPTIWRLTTEYLALRRLFPRSRLFGGASGAGADYGQPQDVEWVTGAAMLVRTEAIKQVGMLDENYFLFGEEVDWCFRMKNAGWNIAYHPGALVTHVGWASHGGRMIRELAVSNLRYMWKHHGPRAAARSRRVMIVGLAARGFLLRDWRRVANREAVSSLRGFSISEFNRRPREAVPQLR
jgi:N-acetylglucosaminyl-diphospho-decaprenol L-rhamnosyltransferase